MTVNSGPHSELRARIRNILHNSDRQQISIEGYRAAAVLVPIILGPSHPELLFTKRTELVETHKGQVSFPGGMMDPDDESVERTALREAWEEIGIPETAIELSGLLDDHPTPTGFLITPVVGIIERLPALAPSEDEVAGVFQVPLSFFANPENGRRRLKEFRGAEHEVWYYQYGGHSIWGATATIIRSLLRRLDLL